MLQSKYSAISNSTGVLNVDSTGRIRMTSAAWLSRYCGLYWNQVTFSESLTNESTRDLLERLADASENKLIAMHLIDFQNVMVRCDRGADGYKITIIKVAGKETSSSLQTALSSFSSKHSAYALLLFNCEDVFGLNAALGYDKADQVLGEVGRIIEEEIKNEPHAEYLALTGGQYAVLAADMSCEKARDIHRAASVRTRSIECHELRLNASCTFSNAANDDVDSVLLSAESLLDIAKQDIDKELAFAEIGAGHQVVNTRLELERAVARREFKIHYQPILDLSNKRIVAVEALARWEHPTKGLLPPSEFIDKLQKFRLMESFGALLIESVTDDLARWGRPEMKVSINISPVQLSGRRFAEKLLKHISESNLRVEQFQVEVTEESASSTSVAREVTKLLKGGVSVVIDDFGIGYSNIVSLRTLSLSAIKIDKSLLFDSVCRGNGDRFFDQVVQMCKSISKSVVIEGIESVEHEKVAVAAGATLAQGFLYARPMAASELEKIELWKA